MSRDFDKKLKTICLLVIDIIKTEDFEFLNTPREIAMNPKFMPHFKIRQMMFIVINNTKISSDSASHYL